MNIRPVQNRRLAKSVLLDHRLTVKLEQQRVKNVMRANTELIVPSVQKGESWR